MFFLAEGKNDDKMGFRIVAFLLVILMQVSVRAQTSEQNLPVKVSHAEPIYFDLIRDLGARKGERELNVGMGLADHKTHSEYSYLVEYEFAPVNRLGLEVEVPLAFTYNHSQTKDSSQKPSNGIEGIKAAMQYSFFVSQKWNTTMAVGYIFERGLAHHNQVNAHNPFFIIAKRWGRQFHSLLYAGPLFERSSSEGVTTATLINASIHYMVPGTKNFIGVEANDELRGKTNIMIVRPQLKMALSPISSVGLSVGISTSHTEHYVNFLVRWIYEIKKRS